MLVGQQNVSSSLNRQCFGRRSGVEDSASNVVVAGGATGHIPTLKLRLQPVHGIVTIVVVHIVGPGNVFTLAFGGRAPFVGLGRVPRGVLLFTALDGQVDARRFVAALEERLFQWDHYRGIVGVGGGGGGGGGGRGRCIARQTSGTQQGLGTAAATVMGHG